MDKQYSKQIMFGLPSIQLELSQYMEVVSKL